MSLLTSTGVSLPIHTQAVAVTAVAVIVTAVVDSVVAAVVVATAAAVFCSPPPKKMVRSIRYTPPTRKTVKYVLDKMKQQQRQQLTLNSNKTKEHPLQLPPEFGINHF